MWWCLSSEAPDSFSPKEHTFGFIQVCVSRMIRSRISCFLTCHLFFSLGSTVHVRKPSRLVYGCRSLLLICTWKSQRHKMSWLVSGGDCSPTIPWSLSVDGGTARLHFPSSSGFPLSPWPSSGQKNVSRSAVCLPQAKAFRSTFPFPCFTPSADWVLSWWGHGGMAATQDEKSQTNHRTKESWPPARVPLRDYYKEWEVGSVWFEGLCYVRSFSYPSPAYPNYITAPGCLESHKSQMTVQSSEVKLKWSIWLTRTQLSALKISPNYKRITVKALHLQSMISNKFAVTKWLKTKNSVPWRRQWHLTPVLLPGKSHGWRSLVGCSPWGH